ncbi:hypothetical protein [Williamsia sp. DF01-3]|nr:hypothetical protein [Williamsia sp. DF01-3]
MAADDIEVTPASLRAHAAWIFDTGLPTNIAHALNAAADQMESES